MIAHLRGRERKLELHGWTGQDAEWIALVCLHSGVFTRAQFCQYFDTAGRVRAHRFVKMLLARKQAVETEWPTLNNGGKTCRISNKAIYRALGVENIRHRRTASDLVVMRRLLSLDFVLEHPGMNWLPAEPEKVEFFEEIGLPLRLIPRRIYCGMVGNQKRYFALKLPLAVDPKIVTFAYVDPGHQTDTELYSWGAAHGPLWDALRKKGRQVRVIGIAVENAILDRTDRVLETWAAAVALAACGPQTADADAPEYEGMLRYCEWFATAAPARVLKSPGAHYIAGSARVFRTRLGDVVTFLSNTFQPSDSRFDAAWQCTFSISMDDQHCTGEVALPIAERAEFAGYTSWSRLAIVDDNRIVTSGGSTIGFATPKYFETSCPVEGDGTEGWQKNP